MEWLAHKVVLGLGRLTFAVLHFFECLGVDMTTIDEALAGWTSYATDLKTHLADVQAALEAALADAQQLRDTDAAGDAAQAEALKASVADQIAAALEAVKNPPVPPVETPPVDQPPVDQPPVDQPPVEEPPVVVDPPVEAPPADQPPV